MSLERVMDFLETRRKKSKNERSGAGFRINKPQTEGL